MNPLFHLEALRPLIQLPDDISWRDIEEKFLLGVISHAGEPSLAEMDQERLEKEIKDETIDLLIYKAEKLRRKASS